MKFYYIFDPLCVFCYGFSQIIHNLYNDYKEEFEFELLPGGLWIDSHKKRVTPQVAVNLTKASKKIGSMSGRVFGDGFYELLETDHEFDSFIGSKAFLTAAELDNSDPLNYLEKLYELTFIRGNNTNNEEMYIEAAKETGLDSHMFKELFTSQDKTDETRNKINKVREMGVKSYPTLLLEKEGAIFSYDINYGNYDLLKNWVESTK